VTAGKGRTILNDEAPDVLPAGIVATVSKGDGVTSVHAAENAAISISTLLEDATMWNSVEGGPTCKVTCNGAVCTLSNNF